MFKERDIRHVQDVQSHFCGFGKDRKWLITCRTKKLTKKKFTYISICKCCLIAWKLKTLTTQILFKKLFNLSKLKKENVSQNYKWLNRPSVEKPVRF